MVNAPHYSLANLRRSLFHFAIGKGFSAALNFCALILLVRLLSVPDYGRYVTLIAVVELTLALGSFGLDWVAIRHIPDFRVRAGSRALRIFIVRIGTIQIALYSLIGIALGLGAGVVESALQLPIGTAVALQIYAAYLVIEGLSRMARDQIMGQLLLQGRAQVAMGFRNLTWVAGLLWFLYTGEATLVGVATVELLAASTGALAAVLGLSHALITLPNTKPAEDWSPPSLRAMFNLAASTYLSYLLALAYGPYIVTLLIARMGGSDMAAIFGFARNLSEQVRRYLPAELLIGLIRPVLVSRFSQSRDFLAFNRNLSLVFTVSIIALVPILVLIGSIGDLVSMFLSAGKYPNAGVLLFLFLATLIPFSHRRCIELVANITGHPQACVRGSIYLLIVPILIGYLLWTIQDIRLVLCVMLIAECIFSGIVVHSLRNSGVMYQIPWRGISRCVLAMGIACGVATRLPLVSSNVIGIVIHAVICTMLSFGLLWALRPFDASDEKRLLIWVHSRLK